MIGIPCAQVEYSAPQRSTLLLGDHANLYFYYTIDIDSSRCHLFVLEVTGVIFDFMTLSYLHLGTDCTFSSSSRALFFIIIIMYFIYYVLLHCTSLLINYTTTPSVLQRKTIRGTSAAPCILSNLLERLYFGHFSPHTTRDKWRNTCQQHTLDKTRA